jgi:hypothetical protein
VSSTPAATIAPAPTVPVAPPPVPAAAAETQPAQVTTTSTAEAGTSEPVTKTLPDSDVGGTQVDPGGTGPARGSNRLGDTGDGTGRLMILGGVALLIGAVIVAFTGRDEPLPVGAAAIGAAPGGPVRRRAILSAGRLRTSGRRGIHGWEDGVPLAPGKRELARRRAGVSVYPNLDGGPEA